MLSQRDFAAAATGGGLTNQRLSVLRPLELARQNQYRFVVPSFIGSNQIGISFSSLYSVAHLKRHARSLNFTVTDALPENLVPSCTSDLLSNDCPHVSGQIHMLHEKELRGVVCLSFSCSFLDYWQHKSEPSVESSAALDLVRPGLVPSRDFREQVKKLLTKLPDVSRGADSFVTVHVRTEADFEAACKDWPSDKWGRVCWANEVDICNFLLSRLPKSSMLLIASGHDSASLPNICGNFTCFDKTVLGYEPSPHLTVNAFIDWGLAMHGKAFYGNIYSSFSQEMVAEFRSKQLGPYEYYNFNYTSM